MSSDPLLFALEGSQAFGKAVAAGVGIRLAPMRSATSMTANTRPARWSRCGTVTSMCFIRCTVMSTSRSTTSLCVCCSLSPP